MKETEEQQIKELEKIIYRPMLKHQICHNAEIMRIKEEDDLTRIDFIYYATPYYKNGGWVQLEGGTFIRPIETKQRLTLVKAVNMPIAPTKHWFKSTKEFLCYTLYFPPLPKGTTAIDIIECDVKGGDWFNFYGISMERVRTEKIIVGN